MNSSVFFWVLGATLLVSLVSFVGVVTLSFSRVFLSRILLFLVSLAAGTLFGDVFFHLLPESVEGAGGLETGISFLVLGGILLFFVIEKFLVWHHHHTIETPESHALGDHSHTGRLGVMNLVGDAVHNLLDGMIIAASFLVSPAVGIGTTLAVLLHEIPQEVSDFGVLIHAGFSVRRALFFNFLSALMALLGALITLYFGTLQEGLVNVLVPLVAGGFLYIAGSDLIPELHRQVKWRQGVLQLFMLVVGMGVMWGLTLME